MAKKKLYQLKDSFKKGNDIYRNHYVGHFFYEDAIKKKKQLVKKGKKVIVKSAYERAKLYKKVRGRNVYVETKEIRVAKVYTKRKNKRRKKKEHKVAPIIKAIFNLGKNK